MEGGFGVSHVVPRKETLAEEVDMGVDETRNDRAAVEVHDHAAREARTVRDLGILRTRPVRIPDRDDRTRPSRLPRPG